MTGVLKSKKGRETGGRTNVPPVPWALCTSAFEANDVPQWLREGDYELEYHLDASALLQMCSPYASIAAISRASGINQHQLSHYANGIKKPRPEQRRRIIEGIHKIGRELIAIE